MKYINNYSVALLASILFVLINNLLIEEEFHLEETIKEFILCYCIVLGSIYLLTDIVDDINPGEPITTGLPSFTKLTS